MRRLVLSLAATVLGSTAAAAQTVYEAPLQPPAALRPYLVHIEGDDTFATEADALTVEATLRTLRGTPLDVRPLLASDFRGSLAIRDVVVETGTPALTIRRGLAAPGTGSPQALDAAAFARAFAARVSDLPASPYKRFDVTRVERSDGLVETDVRFELTGARRSHTGTWTLRWRPDDASWRIVDWRVGQWTSASAAAPLFREVTTQALAGNDELRWQLGVPLDDWMGALDSVLTRDSNGHHGIAVGDVDGDGWDDIYVAQPSGLPNRLLRARGDGTFEDITHASGLDVLDDSAQPVFADLDNDGDQDLVLATSTAPLAFRNDGRGRFTPIEDAFRFDAPLQGLLTGVTLADFDRDGYLDVYLCVYLYFFGANDEKAGTPAPYHDARNGPPGVLFRNDGTGRFIDVTKASGLGEANERFHFAAAWGDFDEDGWPDLFVANDFGTKNLFRNLGPRNGVVQFEDVAARAGVLDHGAGMSAAFLDYDNDGHLDIATGNMWSASGQRTTASPAFMPDAPEEIRALYRRHTRGNGLFRNRSDGTFEDVTLSADVAMGRWAWSTDAVDLDSDGWQDILVATGMLTRKTLRADLESYFWRQVAGRSPQTFARSAPYDLAWRAMNERLVHDGIASHQRNIVLRNDGRGRFDDVSAALGLDLDQDGRGFAVLDLDHDGDPDLAFMAARQAPQLRVFRNDHPARATWSLRLTGTSSNRDAIGARVTVETDRLRVTRMVSTSTGFLSQHTKTLLFGLGDSEAIRTVTVYWPSGATQVFRDVALDTRMALTEGGQLEALSPVAPVRERGAASSDVTETSAADRTLRPPSRVWMYATFPAPETSLGGAARPRLVLLRDTRHAASTQALEQLRARGADIARAGLAIEDVPLDTVSRELSLTWVVTHRHLFMNLPAVNLPTLLLVDATGEIVCAWRDGFDVDAVLADAAQVDATPEVRLRRALPFAGTFHQPLAPRHYVPFGRDLLDQGLEAAAIRAVERASQVAPDASMLYRLGTLLVRTGQVTRAREAFTQAIALDPQHAEALNDLGALMAEGGDIPAAITRFRQALAAMPDYPDALNNLGYALLLTGQEDEAQTLYERALALQPDFPEARNNLGLLRAKRGALSDAESHFRRALADRPDYVEASNNLALVLASQGRDAEAMELLEAQLVKTPDHAGTLFVLARIQLAAGQAESGLATLERLLARHPDHAAARALLRQVSGR